MSSAVVEVHPWPVVMLEEAELCQDCNAITSAPNGHCARCGSRALLNLANVLNRQPACEEAADAVL